MSTPKRQDAATRAAARAYRRAKQQGAHDMVAHGDAEHAALAAIATPQQLADARAAAIAAARQYDQETEQDNEGAQECHSYNSSGHQ